MYPRYILLAISLLLVAFPSFAQAPRVQALDYVRREAPVLGLSVEDVADLIVTDAYTSRRSGTTHVYLRQSEDGIEVMGSEMTVNVGRDGRVFHASGQMISNLDARVESQRPSLDAMSAAFQAASYVGIQALPTLRILESDPGNDRATTFSINGLENNPVRTKLVYKQDAVGAYHLAWEIELALKAQSEYWLVYVDAVDGQEVARINLTVFDTFGHAADNGSSPTPTPSFAPFESAEQARAAMAPTALVGSYRAFQLPVESPNHASPAAPADGRVLHTNPDNATASPFGWHDTDGVAGAESNLTTGNNVDAHKGATRTDGGASLIFDNPANFANSPETFVPAAITNAFYLSNIFHDITYQYGFDEAAGNFQENNYGNGGMGSDGIDANVQAPGNCNAQFGTPSDGSNPTMNMFLCTTPNPDGDTDFDAGVLFHEIGHGISNRLTGGPGNVGCLDNAEQMGEGWSDFFGISLTMEVGDTRTDSRGVATYSLTGEAPGGNGIRLAPYDTDFADNDYTYGRTTTMSIVHEIGFVWATILWEALWDMVDAHGFSADFYNASGTAGNQIMVNLVTEGMKLQPCSPGFVDGRDGILAADAALYPDAGNPGLGLHYATLWQAFARRGLGFSASQGSSNVMSDNVEAFDVPLPLPSASVNPTLITTSVPAPGDMTSEVVVLSNTAAAGSADLTYDISFTDTTPVPFGEKNPSHVEVRAAALATGANSRTDRMQTAPGRQRNLGSIAKTLTGPMPATPGVEYLGGSIVADGGFEAGTPNPSWAEASTNFGTPICSAALCGTGGGTGPHSGTFWTWFGGIIGVAETGSVEQSVTIPGGVVATLSFWHEIPAASTTGFMSVQVDGNEVFRTTDADAGTYAVYTEVIVDVSAFADGAAHTLRFESTTDASAGVLNFFLDDVAITTALGWVTAVPNSGGIAPGGSDDITLDFDATGLTTGTYTADMNIATNDPAHPTLTVPITFIVGQSSVEIAGGPGWRYMAPAMDGMTVDSLASQNLVQGIPGYYPSAATNLYTDWDGSAWTAPSGGSDALTLGEGFAWYFYDNDFDPGGPSVSVSLPMDIVGNGTAASSDVGIGLHTNGDNWNLVGNPFTTSLDVTGMGGWVTSGTLASVIGQLWDSSMSTYRLTSAIGDLITAWQGMFIENSTAPGMTYPTSAQTTGGVFYRHAPTGLIAFELEGTAAATSEPTLDAAIVLYLHPEADAGWDLYDATKLNPLSASYATLAFVGERDGDPISKAQEARSFEAENFIVPLSFNAAGTGTTYTLRWPQMLDIPDSWEFILHDLDTGASVDLREVSEYTFQAVPTREAQPAGPLFVPAVESARGGTLRFELDVTTGVATSNEGGSLPTTFALNGGYPNPFNPSTTIRYDVPSASDVQLEVFDMLGRRVALLVDGRIEAGRHAIRWNAETVASGVYVIRMSAGDFVQAQRMTLLK